ncbi:farnesol dehydrogenase-like [Photinus pyralis]|uniref:Dehydrogenase n=2 Tax=Photinus pyralis TaxID=7054 RepID=A0A1Y1NJC3_PHOPY|nr:farnesol dehydrogenase-like [Photinus pyralis]
MERWRGKVAVVTGASMGIGAAISEALVNSGLRVIGIARRIEPIEQKARQFEGRLGKLYPVKADVSKEEDVLGAFEWITNNVGPVQILINNAAVTLEKSLLSCRPTDWATIIDINVIGLCTVTNEAVRIMRAHGNEGHIVHINSLAGHNSTYYPGANVYPASKHAVTALTEALRQELNYVGSKIKVTSISPGLVDTPKVAELKLQDHIIDNLANGCFLRDKDVADSVCYVLGTPPHVQIRELMLDAISTIS